MLPRTPLERQVYAAAVGALVTATAGDLLADGAGQAHRIHDAAMYQVAELRTRAKADRLRKRKAGR